jgi:hypothetical protein
VTVPAGAHVVVEALMERIVDYAGLFPPAQLSMADAVRHYAEYRAGPDAWMLGRFVVPASRLEEFDEEGGALLPQSAAQSWALSATVSADVELDVRSIDRFNDRHREAARGAVHVDTIEFRATRVEEIVAAEPFAGGYDAFIEVPVIEDPAPLVAEIARVGAKAKIRTGGVTAEQFPGARHVIRFIRCCLDHRVAFKATAGLHHPIRAEYPLTYEADAPRGVMYGFLNVFLAAAFMRAGMDDTLALALLEEREPSSIQVDEDRIRWREQALDRDALRAGRQEALAFGSCSFSEPVTGLRALGLL